MIDFYEEEGEYVLQKSDNQRFLGTIEKLSEKEIESLARRIFKKLNIKTFDDFKKEMEEDRDSYICPKKMK